jgi:hypothetical protein
VASFHADQPYITTFCKQVDTVTARLWKDLAGNATNPSLPNTSSDAVSMRMWIRMRLFSGLSGAAATASI